MVMRIALVCDNASLRMGGQAAIPLRFFRSFRALGLQVELLTHARVEQELRQALTSDELAHVTFFPDLLLQKVAHRAGRVLPGRVREIYIDGVIRTLTEWRQRRDLMQRVQRAEIDVVFQPEPISPKALSLINNVGAPVFFGPLNGAIDYPAAMRLGSGGIGLALMRVGRILSEPLHYVFPAKRNAAGLFFANNRTLENLPKATKNVPRFRSFDATIDASLWQQVDRSGPIDPNHFVYVGRLVDWKGVEFAIMATQKLGDPVRLTIVGDGPERQRLEALAGNRGNIRFAGFRSHEEISKLFASAAALVLPSLREAGGNVCLEALAAGLPVIATKWGGAEDVVISEVDGILVEPLSKTQFVDGLAVAMRKLMHDPTKIRSMGERGRARVLATYDWLQKARDYHRVFEDVLSAPALKSGVYEAHQNLCLGAMRETNQHSS